MEKRKYSLRNLCLATYKVSLVENVQDTMISVWESKAIKVLNKEAFTLKFGNRDFDVYSTIKDEEYYFIDKQGTCYSSKDMSSSLARSCYDIIPVKDVIDNVDPYCLSQKDLFALSNLKITFANDKKMNANEYSTYANILTDSYAELTGFDEDFTRK